MADDKKRPRAERSLAPRTKIYAVDYFAKKHGIPAADARRLIKQHGSDRDAADKAANRLKG
ncbi:DUF3606 domain-containing protein [Ensifer sp.]|uniref:DUF3606 domain-containing protein n=1 Tax=Ensifer sp. TaxID=1872086 RepID=UPI0028A1B675|nr:DUF3606 domain-containing protein [Ensifer sp.]